MSIYGRSKAGLSVTSGNTVFSPRAYTRGSYPDRLGLIQANAYLKLASSVVTVSIFRHHFYSVCIISEQARWHPPLTAAPLLGLRSRQIRALRSYTP